MYPSDLPDDMYTQAQEPKAQEQRCTHQANHEGMWNNWYVPCRLIARGQLITHSNTTEFII